MGRRSKYTPDVIERICAAIRLGATHDLAAKYAGISVATYKVWYASKPAFVAEVEKAEGVAALGWLAKIEKAANDGIWTAAAWKLERRYPQGYGRRALEVSGPEGEPLTFTLKLDHPRDVSFEPVAPLALPSESVALDPPAYRNGDLPHDPPG